MERRLLSLIAINSSYTISDLAYHEICYMKMGRGYFNGCIHRKCGSRLYANLNGIVKCKVCNEFVRKKSDMKRYVKLRRGGEVRDYGNN